MDSLVALIVIVLVAIGILAILLKICQKVPFLNWVFMFVSGLILIINAFKSANHYVDVSKINDWSYICVEIICVICFIEFMWYDIVFDKSEPYLYTEGSWNLTETTFTATTTVREDSNFWPCLGSSALIGVLSVGLQYLLFGPHTGAKIVAIIGIIAMSYFAIKMIINIIKIVKAKRNRPYY